jgi:hypothetical protein
MDEPGVGGEDEEAYTCLRVHVRSLAAFAWARDPAPDAARCQRDYDATY